MARHRLAAAFTLFALADPTGSAELMLPPPQVPIPLPRSYPIPVPRDVLFRYRAAQIQSLVFWDSCPPRAAIRRTVALAPEIAAVRAFENGLAGPARFHWDVARGDMAYRQANGWRNCWNDSDPDFARMHLQSAREGVRRGLPALRALASTLLPLPDGASTPPLNAAALRAHAGNLGQLLDPQCGLDLDRILAPARVELTGLRRRLAGTPYALQLELGISDALYARGVPECAEAAPVPPEVAIRNALLEARRRIDQIEALVRR
jgi:hypothetical protein